MNIQDYTPEELDKIWDYIESYKSYSPRTYVIHSPPDCRDNGCAETPTTGDEENHY